MGIVVCIGTGHEFTRDFRSFVHSISSVHAL